MTLKRASRRPDSGSRLFERFLRENKISQYRAAKQLGVSSVTVHHWIAAFKTPCQANRYAIAVWTGGAVPTSSWPTDAVKVITPFQRTG